MALVVNTAPAAWWTPRPLSPLGLSSKTTPQMGIAGVKPKGSSDQSIHGNIDIGCTFVPVHICFGARPRRLWASYSRALALPHNI